jgi:hypothetical protein
MRQVDQQMLTLLSAFSAPSPVPSLGSNSFKTVGPGHKVRIYKEYYSVCPLVDLGLPHPFPASECAPPPLEPKGRGALSPAGEGWGSPNADDWRKSLALCLLCGPGSVRQKFFFCVANITVLLFFISQIDIGTSAF